MNKIFNVIKTFYNEFWTTIWAIVIICSIVIPVLVGYINNYKVDQNIKTNALIVSVREVKIRGNVWSNYYLRVKYFDGNNVERIVETQDSTNNPKNFKAGETITVYYNQYKPSEVYIFNEYFNVPSIFIYLFFSVAILGVLSIFYNFSKRLKKKK